VFDFMLTIYHVLAGEWQSAYGNEQTMQLDLMDIRLAVAVPDIGGVNHCCVPSTQPRVHLHPLIAFGDVPYNHLSSSDPSQSA